MDASVNHITKGYRREIRGVGLTNVQRMAILVRVLGELERHFSQGVENSNDAFARSCRQLGLVVDEANIPEIASIETNATLWSEVIWDLSYAHAQPEVGNEVFELNRLSLVYAYLQYARQIALAEVSVRRKRVTHTFEESLLMDHQALDKAAQRIIIYVQKQFRGKSLRKRNGYVYSQYTIQATDALSGVVQQPAVETHYWKRGEKIEDEIFKLVSRSQDIEIWKDYTGSGCHKLVRDVVSNVPDVLFPFLEVNRDYLSFRNGIYCLSQNMFRTWDKLSELPEQGEIFSRVYIDVDFDYTTEDPRELQCIHFKQIFYDQGFDDETMLYIFALLGRVMYEVGEHDDWQIIPFFKGIAKTGKSTVWNTIMHFFAKEDIGILSSNNEEQFGLGPLTTKLVWFCLEVKAGFKLNQADLQSMASGEMVSAAVKFKEPQMVEWKVPGGMAGNESGPWVDVSESMSRRIPVIEFLKVVKKQDGDLKHKIRNELGSILRLINYCYRDLVRTAQGQGWWDICPSYFTQTRDRLNALINPVSGFLKSENLVRHPDVWITLSDLQDEYQEYKKAQGIRHTPFTYDNYHCIFERLGLLQVEEEVPMPPDGHLARTAIVRGICKKADEFHQRGGQTGAGQQQQAVRRRGRDEAERGGLHPAQRRRTISESVNSESASAVLDFDGEDI